ncbi:MAG: Flp pilus assembly protein CpaB [Candidatus Eisenbacteria bacterium]|nr:Flp pilus assembly protein CpaB [Candidatus Eisenbacteria bacterium]
MTRIRVVVILAVVFGLLAAVAIYRYLAQYDKMIREKKIAEQPVVVAIKDLQFGTVLDETNVEAVGWPVQIVPAGASTSPQDVYGRVVKSPVVAGEAVLETKLVPIGMNRGLAILVPEGMRAMTVPVNTWSGVAGFVLPETKVDVVVTIRPELQREQVGKVILQNLTVLAVDQKIEDTEGKPLKSTAVTLLVTPSEAEKLALSATEGEISLILRNPADSDSAGTKGTTIAQMLSKSEPVQRLAPVRVSRPRPARTTSTAEVKPAAKPAEKKTIGVEVIRGSKRTQEKFEDKTQPK